MRGDVRPRNDVRHLHVSFGITFVILHQIVTTIVDYSSSSRYTISNAKTSCVETDANGFNCANDPREARRRSRRKDVTYYLANYGVRQSQDGNDEERAAIHDVVLRMEDYMRRWIVKYDHDEETKAIW
jgi:hypothetical protein